MRHIGNLNGAYLGNWNTQAYYDHGQFRAYYDDACQSPPR